MNATNAGGVISFVACFIALAEHDLLTSNTVTESNKEAEGWNIFHSVYDWRAGRI